MFPIQAVNVRISQAFISLLVLKILCAYFIFSKTFDFSKNLSPGVFGSLITNLTSILPYEASVPRHTRKISTFWKILFFIKGYKLGINNKFTPNCRLNYYYSLDPKEGDHVHVQIQLPILLNQQVEQILAYQDRVEIRFNILKNR